jgi:flagellar hook-associated protein 2
MASTSALTANMTTAQVATVIQQYQASLTTQQVTPLTTKQTTLNNRLTALSTMQSTLNALSTAADALMGISSTGALPFSSYAVTSSNSSVATATASSAVSMGTHTLSVSRLAKSDTVLSDKITNTDTTIASNELTADEVTAGSGTRQIALSISGSEVATVSVTINANDTNRAVMQSIRDAVNTSLDASKYVSASVVTSPDGTNRLAFVSKATGSSNSVSWSDVTGPSNGNATLLDQVGLTSSIIVNRTPSTSTTAGYVYGGAVSSLDAAFNLDGIDMTSASNTVNNALSGVSLQLNATQSVNDAPVVLTASIDTNAISSNIQSFITAYNNAIGYIKKTTAIDTSTTPPTSQIFSNDMTFINLKYSLQSLAYGPIGGVVSNYNTLFKAGITLNSDGTMAISDQNALNTALQTNPTAVAQLFTAASSSTSNGGVAVQMKSLVKSMTSANGLITSTQDGINSQLNRLKTQISSAQARVAKQASVYQTQYTTLLNAYQQLLQQQTSINSITNYILSTTMVG